MNISKLILVRKAIIPVTKLQDKGVLNMYQDISNMVNICCIR